jgi:hypothetical protein
VRIVLVGGFGRGRELLFTRDYWKGFVSLILNCLSWLLPKERNNNHVFQFQKRKSRARAAKIRAIVDLRRLNEQSIAA